MKLTLGNLIGRFFATDDNYKNVDKPLSYIVASNGLFEQRKNDLGLFYSKTDKIPNMQEVQEGVFLNIPKIPFDLFNKMIAWFRTIYKKDKTESTFMIFYNEKTGFFPFIPEQTNAGASSKYLRDDDPVYTELCKNNTLVMVAHSHPWAGTSAPSPSGTDNNDEKEAILYLIANNVEGVPNVYCSTCPGGKRMKLSFFDLFENPLLERKDIPEDIKNLLVSRVTEKEVFTQFLKPDEFVMPLEWLKKHKTDARTFTGTGTTTGTSKVETKTSHYGYDRFDWDDYYKNYPKTYKNFMKNKMEKEKAKDFMKDLDADLDDYYSMGEYGYGLGYDLNDDVPHTYFDRSIGKEIIVDDETMDAIWKEEEDIAEDLVDTMLDFTPQTRAYVINLLIDNGEDDIINACMKEAEKDKRIKK